MTSKPDSEGGGALSAWLVHLLTASGAVFALLAIEAVGREEWRLALAWLLVALAVDGVDGTLARAFRVKARLPRIDGAVLDLVIDYLNYVFVPALFIWRGGLVPEGAALPLAAAILVSSLYVFARTDMKTDDGYFRGFPALWNVAALYLFAAGLSPLANALIVAALAAASFAPIHFVHPFRVRDYGRWLPALALLWAASSALMLWPDWGDAMRTALFWGSAISGLVLIALGLLRSLRGASRDGENGGRGKD